MVLIENRTETELIDENPEPHNTIRNRPFTFVGKRMVDVLLVLTELFRQLSWLRCYEQILVEIVVFERGWVTFSANFWGKAVVHQRLLASEN